jgi:hypothetical protein
MHELIQASHPQEAGKASRGIKEPSHHGCKLVKACGTVVRVDMSAASRKMASEGERYFVHVGPVCWLSLLLSVWLGVVLVVFRSMRSLSFIAVRCACFLHPG